MDRLTDAVMFAVAANDRAGTYSRALHADCERLLRILRDTHGFVAFDLSIANLPDTARSRRTVSLLLARHGAVADLQLRDLAGDILRRADAEGIGFAGRRRQFINALTLDIPAIALLFGVIGGVLCSILFELLAVDAIRSISTAPLRQFLNVIELLSNAIICALGTAVGFTVAWKPWTRSLESLTASEKKYMDVAASPSYGENYQRHDLDLEVLSKEGPSDPYGHTGEDIARYRAELDRGGLDRITGIERIRRNTEAERSGPDPDRVILITGHDRSGGLVTSFQPQTDYSLRFRVAAPHVANLAWGDIDVSDTPATGLDVQWVVVSDTVEFLAVAPTGTIEPGGPSGVARFDLAIPGAGDSQVVTLVIRTTRETGSLKVVLLVCGEVYREVGVTLAFGTVTDYDRITTTPAHLKLHAPRAWMKPPEHLSVTVVNKTAVIGAISSGHEHGSDQWRATPANLNNVIVNVREALEEVRVEAEQHLNNIPFEDMRARLERGDWKMYWTWEDKPGQTDAVHAHDMARLATTPALRRLARMGNRLFNETFPPGSRLHDIILQLAPGSRLDMAWVAHGDTTGWVPHVPWALMYLDSVREDQPVDCNRFLGLRLRIGSTSWESAMTSRALGAPDEVHALHFLYWGTKKNDEVARESAWQRAAFSAWERSRMVPDPTDSDHRRQVLAALESPTPDPAGVLYFYCHCNAQTANDPQLLFNDTTKPADVVRASDLSNEFLASGPLIFANACMTSTATSYDTSELEQLFFRRGARGFIGTEGRVPVAMASRFAWLYFQFFLRKVDPAPMAAGEALAQARLFLWTQYRNPGGLFYCLTNQYSLYLATFDEVTQLQRATS